ncbi:MAG: Trk system potassium transporter TrkA, partial [Myxococcales bacterium]|nr:Trk system potassium transporter TrkA [Myxococcales bacterium]
MNVVVVGMGETGRHITSRLVQEGHDVTVVDSDAESLARAEEMFDVLVLKGHGASSDILNQIDWDACDLFVAVTNQSEINLISAIRASRRGAKKVVARADDLAYFDDERGLVTDMLGIDLVINPFTLVAREIHRIIRSISALSVEDFADNRVEVIQLPVEKETKLLGKPLRSLGLPEGTLIVAIVREGELIVPGGSDILLVDDDAYIVGLTDRMADVEKLFGRRRRRITRKAMIVGGGTIGLSLAQTLEREGMDVILVDRDRERCQDLASKLHRTVILNGDGTDAHLLEEEGVGATDVFIAVSMEDEVNLMASLLAKDLGAPRCIALVHKPDYTTVCERLGLDVTISPRLAVAKQVLKYVREGEVLSYTSIMEGAGEFLEFLVPPAARIAGVPLMDVNFPRGAVVCAGLGRQGTFVPRGDTTLAPGDRVVVFTTPRVRKDVELLFKKPLFSRR